MQRLFLPLLAIIVLSPTSTFAEPEAESLTTNPRSTPAASGLVPVNGRIHLRHEPVSLIRPEVFASVNGGEAQVVSLDRVRGNEDPWVALYLANISAIGAGIGDTVQVTAGGLRPTSPAVFEVVAEDVDEPLIDGAQITFFLEGVLDVCCDDVQSDECGVGVGVEFCDADDFGIGYYEILNEEGDFVALIPGDGNEDGLRIRGRVVVHPGLDDSQTCFTVVAVDLAGNRTEYPEACVELDNDRSCLEDDSREPAETCSCTSVDRRGISWMLLALMPLVVARRRRSFEGMSR